MLDVMPSKKISKVKKEDIESNLILFGLILVLIMAIPTLWHIAYEKGLSNKPIIQNSSISDNTIKQADLNQDGNIDEKDAKLIKEAFLKNDPESLKADLNQDQKVDAKDYSVFNKIVNLKEKEANNAK